ncbi:hypothetical protein [Bacillus alkalicola]|uniref:Uncharacterized protein n=1 Tax=Evansella alkalicola TaxID=745819 RepID=A0ABS6JMP6_9BACI|nr:hypothetical protein [Bacillus alkalicola]MBU9719829.1 hypothetical protein [Bacillus alkalicola]
MKKNSEIGQVSWIFLIVRGFACGRRGDWGGGVDEAATMVGSQHPG